MLENFIATTGNTGIVALVLGVLVSFCLAFVGKK